MKKDIKYKLLVTDIDGTLTNLKHEIVPQNKKALKVAKDLNLYVTLATGRRPESAYSFVRELSVTSPIIVYNGAGIYDFKNDKFIHKEIFDKQSAIKLVSVLETYELLNTLIYYDHGSYTNRDNEIIEEYKRKDKVELIYMKNILPIVKKEAPIKIMIIGPREELDNFYDTVIKLNFPVSYTNSEVNYLEILPKNASKGNMVKIFANYLNIDLDEVIAVGDKDNDISMVKIAGLGIAVENASSDLKRVAKYIAPPGPEGGVWDVVQKFLLR